MTTKKTDAAAPTKPQVVLLQDAAGLVKRVRVNGVELDVAMAVPTVLPGVLGLNMVLRDVDVTFEALPASDA